MLDLNFQANIELNKHEFKFYLSLQSSIVFNWDP